MSVDTGTTELQDPPFPLRVKLASAWTSFIFLYVYVDHLGLYKPGVVDDILAGVVWEFDISQTWASGALTLVAPFYIPVSMFTAVGESWTYYHTLAIGLEVLLLAFILRSAWTWPRAVSPSVAGLAAPRTASMPGRRDVTS